jgi:hypothetical protein
MPIRPELRHFYRGPAWRATRARILARAGNCCERCKLPNGIVVVRAGDYSIKADDGTLYGPKGDTGARVRGSEMPGGNEVRIQLGIAHLNHVAGDDRDENLAALCRRCHLRNDAKKHAEDAKLTRKVHKDAARPLLRMLEAS